MIAELLFCMAAAAPQGEGVAALKPLPAQRFGLAQARHLLVRAGFGGSAAEVRALHARGLDGAVRWLVDYEALPDPIGPHRLTPQRRPPRFALERLSGSQRRELAAMRRRADRANLARLRVWWVARLLRTRRPLEEKMTLLWTEYFGVTHGGVRDAFALAVHQDALREHATANFGELLHEMVCDPAVLTEWGNVRARRRSPSRRFARALLEKFTLGPGEFAEDDVDDVARAFTGWGVRPGTTTFRFEPRDHDWGFKVILGQRGAWNGADVVDLLLREPATARHVTRRIVRYLAGDPPSAVLEALADVLRRSDYELKPVLRALFRSRWFYSPEVMGRQERSILATAVGLARALGLGTDVAPRIARLLERSGASFFGDRRAQGAQRPGFDVLARALTSAWSPAPTRARPLPWGAARPATVNRRVRARGRPRDVVAAGRNATRGLVRLLVDDARRPEDLLARLEERLLVVPLTPEHRRRLLAVLAGREEQESRQRLSSVRARVWRAIRLLASLPEFARQ